MRKLWANLTAAFMALTMLAGCNEGAGDEHITPPTSDTHACAYVKEVVDAAYLKRSPTCTTAAQYYYSCECGEMGTDFFVVGQPSGHRGGTATETQQAICEVCRQPYGALLGGGDPEHTHAYNRQVIEDSYKVSGATCASPAVYRYSCECGKSGENTFTYGEPTGAHTYNQKVKNDDTRVSGATCDKAAVYRYSCECGDISATETFEDGEPTGAHTYNQKVKNDDTKVSDATCGKPAVYRYSCKCGDISATETFEDGEPTDAHVYDKKVKNDDTKVSGATCDKPAVYRYSCECGDISSTETFEDGEPTGAHIYNQKVKNDDTRVSEATCDKAAVYRYSCECGDISATETFTDGEPTGAHIYNQKVKNDDTKIHDATCDKPAEYYYSCSCGHISSTETFTDGSPTGLHTYDQKVKNENTKIHDATCSELAEYYYSCICGDISSTETFEDGEKAAHDFTKQARKSKYLKSDATCQSPKVYYYACSVCDESSNSDDYTYTYGSKEDHDYTREAPFADYLKDNATCIAKATYYYACQTCDMRSVTSYYEYGNPTGIHTVGTPATENQQATCSECGQPFGETLSHAHSFTREVVELKHLKQAATCGAAAQYWKSCSCGEDARYTDDSAYFSAGEGTGKHTGGTATTSKKAVCSVCGQEYGEVLLSQVNVSSVSSGYTRYDVNTAHTNKTEGFGTQFDTCIVERQNSLTDEEWNIQVEAIKEMNLQNVRIRFYPEMYERGNDNNDPNSFDFSSTNVDFSSNEMQHLYQLLDVFKANNVKVDLSWYGCRTTFRSEDGKISGSWLADTTGTTNWMVAPTSNAEYAESVAACLQYLMVDKGYYTCINEYSLFPEPEGVPNLSWPNDYNEIASDIQNRLKSIYVDVTNEDGSVTKKAIADIVKLSGPASMEIAYEKFESSSATWGTTANNYANTLGQIGDNLEKATSSAYPFTINTSNAHMLKAAQSYVQTAAKYGLTWGIAECGTANAISNVANTDAAIYDRAMFMARFFINMVNGGCTNIKYFVFSDCNYDSTLNELGLFYFRGENFRPKPVWFTWSLICRYTDIGSEVYPITSADSDVCITALKLPDGSWTYVAANGNTTTAKKVAIVNGRADRARSMNMYVVTPSVAASDKLKVVSASSSVSTVNGVAEFTIPVNGVVVLSNKA